MFASRIVSRVSGLNKKCIKIYDGTKLLIHASLTFAPQLKNLKTIFMKKSVLISFLLLVTVAAFSQDDEQKTFKFGLGTSLSLPVSDLKTSTSYGVGFELIGDYNFSEHLSAFLQSGVDVFKSNTIYGDADNIGHIPVIAGARVKSNGFFAGAGAGYGFWFGDGSDRGFLYSPQIGYEMEHYQFMAHYTSTAVKGGSLSYFGIKVFRTF